MAPCNNINSNNNNNNNNNNNVSKQGDKRAPNYSGIILLTHAIKYKEKD